MAFLGITICIGLVGPGRFSVMRKMGKLDGMLSNVEWSWSDIGVLVLRVVTALLIVHHGIDKLQNVETFSTKVIAVYFPFLPGPPSFWTYLSSGFEIVGSFCWIAGWMARPAAALLGGTMVNAIAFHLMAFGLQNYPFGQSPKGPAYTYEPSLAFLGVCAFIALHGPGKFALKPNGF